MRMFKEEFFSNLISGGGGGRCTFYSGFKDTSSFLSLICCPFLNLFKENSSSETITLYFHLFRTASIAILTSTILDQTYEANCRFRTNWHCFHVCIGEIDKTCLND